MPDGSCFGIGVAQRVLPGPCQEEGLSLREGILLLERAIDRAQDEANKSCERGACVGTITVISATKQQVHWPPVRQGGEPELVCVWTVSVKVEGHCA